MNKILRIPAFVASLAYLAASAYAEPPCIPPTVITSLPFIITVPGKYVLKSDLTFSLNAGFWAIQISCSDVTIDLKGHTLTGPGAAVFKGYAIKTVQTAATTIPLSDIVVKNGTLTAFPIPLEIDGSDCLFKNLTFSAFKDAIAVSGINHRITDCTFIPGPDALSGISTLYCQGLVISHNHFLPPPQGVQYPLIFMQQTIGDNTVINNDDVSPQ